MLVGLISFMIGNERTTGSKSTSSGKKRQLALDSIAFNLNHPGFLKAFSKEYQNSSYLFLERKTNMNFILNVSEFKFIHLSEKSLGKRFYSMFYYYNEQNLYQKIQINLNSICMNRIIIIKQENKNYIQHFLQFIQTTNSKSNNIPKYVVLNHN